MKREEFRAVTSQLTRGQKIRLKISNFAIPLHSDFDGVYIGKVYDRGPSFITIAVKGKGGGLKSFLFSRVESLCADDTQEKGHSTLQGE